MINLEPHQLWKHFEDILKIPRPSGHEAEIRNHLIQFADRLKLDYRVDPAGNLLIIKPACKGLEAAPVVILQSHLDMVGEKHSEHKHDFLKDPIDAYVDGNWIKARGTTLGADDGIGIAAQMAILEAKDLDHGRIECLFTVEEETGLTGAFGLEQGFMQGKILINLDSEDEGELFIGCAGGVDTTAWLIYLQEEVPEGYLGFRITVSGLKGGHSGDDIHKGLGNSNKILARFLRQASEIHGLRIHGFDGGNLRNAIPREARANIAVSASSAGRMLEDFDQFVQAIKGELIRTEPDLAMTMQASDLPDWVIDPDAQLRFLHAVTACPHGVIAWSQTMPGMVETSTNLAAIKFIDDRIKITTSQRSSLESAKKNVADMVESVMLLAGAKTERGTGYPGWNPNPDSLVLKITREAYQRLFGVEPVVRSIHAGLECGLFLEKYPDLDMVSFGPTIRGAHSPDERLDIESTRKFWTLLTEVLKQIK